MNGLAELRVELERRRGREQQLTQDAQTAEKKLVELNKEMFAIEEAVQVIQEVARLTQEELEYHVSELVTLAMAAVFDNPYELIVEFVLRRNRTEADIWFERDGTRIHPMSSSGGGAVDVAAFALRIALWSLANPKTRSTLILDEPLHFLKGGDLPEKGTRMIKEISEHIGVQIIMISHIPHQIEGADRRIGVSMRNGVSQTNNL